MNSKPIFDQSGMEYQRARMEQWDKNAVKRDSWKGLGGWYHKRLTEYYKFLINPNQRILEVGCGLGDLLASLEPSRGVGVDFSAEAIARAKKRHPHLEFHQLDAHDLSSLAGEFDVIVFSDAINDL